MTSNIMSTQGLNPNKQHTKWRIISNHCGHYSSCSDKKTQEKHPKLTQFKSSGKHQINTPSKKEYTAMNKTNMGKRPV